MNRLGLGYDVLKTVNPRLIYAAVSGFDKDGPHAQRPAFDTLLQAAGGLISVTGHPGPGNQVRVGVSIIDICSALYTLSGITTAIADRARTGKGQRVDTTMLAVVANVVENPISRFASTGIIPEPQGLAHPVCAPFNAYTTKDGQIYVAIANTSRYVALVKALGHPELATDPRFVGNEDRMKNKPVLEGILNELFSKQTTAQWESVLIPGGVPVSAINNVSQLRDQYPEVGQWPSVPHSHSNSIDRLLYIFTEPHSSCDHRPLQRSTTPWQESKCWPGPPLTLARPRWISQFQRRCSASTQRRS